MKKSDGKSDFRGSVELIMDELHCFTHKRNKFLITLVAMTVCGALRWVLSSCLSCDSNIFYSFV